MVTFRFLSGPLGRAPLVGCAALLVAVVMGLATPAYADDERPGLSVTSAQATYGSGDDVSLIFVVSNGSPAPCQLSTVADATIDIVAMTRDGQPVKPAQASAYFGTGLQTSLRQGLRTVPAGAKVRLSSAAIDAALVAVTPIAGGGGAVTLWPVGTAGHYVLSVVYAAPTLPASTVPQCAGVSSAATVSFTIAAAGGNVLTTRRATIAVSIAIVIVLLLVAMLWWRSRRRGHRATAVVSAALLAVIIVGLATSAGRPAYASWGVNKHGSKAFAAAVHGCFDKFDAPGGDPADIMSTIEKPGNPRVDIRQQLSGAGSNTWGTPEPPSTPGSSTILWNSEADEDHSDGGAIDPCAELYHELAHAFQFMKKTASADLCGDTGIQVDEVQASFDENAYRATHHLGVRINYNGNALPSSLKVCDDRRKAPPQTPPCKAYAGGSACAASNGDPHLTTFDGYRYDFQAVGEFVAARSTVGDLEIQTRQSPLNELRTISVNTAAALRVGTDRLGFYMVAGIIVVHLNGHIIAEPSRTLALPGGGVLRTVASSVYLDGNGYSVTWPDSSTVYVDQIGPWGLRLFAQLAPDRMGHVTGLLGSFDANADNDLATRAGAVLPTEPTFTQMYTTFAASWRISATESLFDYGTGQSTATFTDRTFPDRAISSEDLPPGSRDQAEAACTYAGVTGGGLLRDCILDVALTGQQAFAINAGDTQTIIPSTTGPATTAGASGQTSTLDIATPDTTATYSFTGTAGQKVYVDVPSATVPTGCADLTLFAPDGTSIGGGCIIDGSGFIDTTALPATGTYRLVLSAPGGATGHARIDVITTTDQNGTITVGGSATQTISQAGATSTLTFAAAAGQRVFIDVPTTTFPITCTFLTLYAPDGENLNNGCSNGSSGFIDATSLRATGTYRLVLDPAANQTGSAQIHLSTLTDQSASTVIGGPAATMTIAQPGAVSTLSFAADAGTTITVDASQSGVSLACGVMTLVGPDGIPLQSGCIVGGVGQIASYAIAATGTYRIVFDLAGDETGSVHIRVSTA